MITNEKIPALAKQCDLTGTKIAEDTLIVFGYMNFEEEADPKFDFHDCDAMGCGSVGPHVIFRFDLADGIAK